MFLLKKQFSTDTSVTTSSVESDDNYYRRTYREFKKLKYYSEFNHGYKRFDEKITY